MAYTAQDVKKLREETDAPMMECKAALDEADGDMEKAKQVLREKGKASAGKKAGRATNAGAVAFAASECGCELGVAVIESETDFVSNNENFQAKVAELAAKALAEGTLSEEAKKEFAVDVVAMFRENCEVKLAEKVTADAPISFYRHHDGTIGTYVVSTGDNAGSEAIRQIAVHIAAIKPQVVSKDDLSQELLDSEYQTQYQRALNEGKPANIAENMAKGRVNKEFIKEAVLLEQPFYKDAGMTVAQFLAQEAKGTTITAFKLVGVGQ
ncbi:MAG: translation elongation factor Ts [Fimbriimonas sp.]|jgi:elongation factor Ts|nr:translation elongation factor Ts [Fimbriimonas sp.]